jgi:LytS/YehU family sensor histidine kinase
LTNVVGLIEHDPARARQMLERFTDYLRGSLGRLRNGDTTLGAELDLVDAYLCALKARMDERLNTASTWPPICTHWPCPRCCCSPWLKTPFATGWSLRSKVAT